MSVQALVNGVVATSIGITDRGLHYGDGVFRTLKVRAGRPLAWSWYIQALAADCEKLRLKMPEESCFQSDANTLFDDGGDGVLKLMVTRGSGGRGYGLPGTPEENRLSLRYPLPPSRPAALMLGWAETRLGSQPGLAGVKHLNRLEQVMVAAELAETACDELIVCNEAGQPICGGMSNLFAVMDGRVITPDLARCGVVGVTRTRIIHLAAAHGISLETRNMSRKDLEQADALAVSNSLLGLRPASALGNSVFPAHPVLTRLATLLDEDALC